MKTNKIIFLLLTPLVFSCEMFVDDRSYCSSAARELSPEEHSIVNFNVNDSTLLMDQSNDTYYIKCISHEYEKAIYKWPANDKDCKGGESTNTFYHVLANFKTNIPTKGQSNLGITLELKTISMGDVSKFDIEIFADPTGWHERLYFAAKTGSTEIMEDPKFSYIKKYPSVYDPATFLNYKDQCKIQNKIFDSVYIFYRDKNSNHKSDIGIVDTLYYQPNYGILKLVFDDKTYQFKDKF